MAEKQKIEVSDAPDEEKIDIAEEATDEQQDEWTEQLEEETELPGADDTEKEEHENSVDETFSETSETINDGVEENQEATIEQESNEDEKTVDEAIEEAEAADEEKDKELEEKVDEIVRQESDDIIKAEDEAREQQFTPPVEKRGLAEKIKNAAVYWWQHKKLRYGTLAGLVIAVIIALFVPFTRYTLLNLAGIRVKASVNIVDSVSGLPLKNIPVELQGKQGRTDDEGLVSFEGLRQGDSLLKVDKRGYAPLEKHLTLGWGSNPIGDQSITATGTQLNFSLTDWLSNKPITDAEAISGEDIGQSDDVGHIKLVIGETSENNEVSISAEGYRTETFLLDSLVEGDNQIKLVTDKKHAFVSNRSGRYDLYSIDADGKNEKVLLAATGKEREVPFVLPHQTRDFIAYISSRDGDVNKDKFILDGLFVVDTISGETYKVTRSEQLQLIGWEGNKLIYVAVVEGVSAGNSGRSKLFAYDLDTKERKELASANYFNDVKIADSLIYYSISSYAVPASQAKLFSIKSDGSDKKTVLDSQVWSIIRKDYETLLLNATDLKWYEVPINGKSTLLDVEPAQKKARIYATSPDGKHAVWVDIRDGKGVLLNYEPEEKKETVLLTKPGLGDPVYWLDDHHLVYRVTTTQETADYVMSIDGGEPQKIADVIGNRSRYFF